MNLCANFGPDRPSCLAAYKERMHAHTHTTNFIHIDFATAADVALLTIWSLDNIFATYLSNCRLNTDNEWFAASDCMQREITYMYNYLSSLTDSTLCTSTSDEGNLKLRNFRTINLSWRLCGVTCLHAVFYRHVLSCRRDSGSCCTVGVNIVRLETSIGGRMNKNLAIANTSRLSCAHSTSRGENSWHWNLG